LFRSPRQGDLDATRPINHIASLVETDKYIYAGGEPINRADHPGIGAVVCIGQFIALEAIYSKNDRS
jgi:hypothetical protein